MKKRVKLLTTIASLCLAVALMAFGVYAANNVVGGVTTSITYTANPNVKATLTYSTALTNATAVIGEEDYTVVTDKALAGSVLTGKAVEELGTEAIGDLVLSPVDSSSFMEYSYTVTIKNDASEHDTYDELVVVLTAPASLEKVGAYDTEGYEITYTNAWGTEGATANTVTIGAGDTATYTVKIKVDSAKSQTTKRDMSTSFTLEAR